MTDRELMQMALDALESSRVFVTSREQIKHPEGTEWYDERIEALRARLAQPEPEPYPDDFIDALRYHTAISEQPEQEPVATVYDAYDATGIDWHCKDAPATGTKLYTAPPQREWQGLTDEEITSLVREAARGSAINRDGSTSQRIARAIEAKLKEKNT